MAKATITIEDNGNDGLILTMSSDPVFKASGPGLTMAQALAIAARDEIWSVMDKNGSMIKCIQNLEDFGDVI